MNFYVHDFLIEKTDFPQVEAWLYHFTMLCSLNPVYEQEEIERFSISVGNPDGIQAYLTRLGQAYSKHDVGAFFISDKFFVTNFYEEENVINQLKDHIEKLSAKNEKILRIKMMMIFSWEHEGYPAVIQKLFD